MFISLCFVLEVLFVSCVGECGCGDVRSWGECCWGRRMEVCVMGICGESRDV